MPGMRHMLKCRRCSNKFPRDEIHKVGSIQCCKACAEQTHFLCFNCNAWLKNSQKCEFKLYKNSDSNSTFTVIKYCSDCNPSLSELYADKHCMHCRRVFENVSVIVSNDLVEGKYCNSCIKNEDLFLKCNKCNKYIRQSYRKTGSDSKKYCHICYAQTFKSCINCNNIYIKEAFVDDICLICLLGAISCANCGKKTIKYCEYKGEKYCLNCLKRCHGCGLYVFKDDIVITADGYFYCECCIINCATCIDCKKKYRREISGYNDINGKFIYICHQCINNNWYSCVNCNIVWKNNSIYIHESCKKCGRCGDNCRCYLKQAHYKPDTKPLIGFDDFFHLGIEMETANKEHKISNFFAAKVVTGMTNGYAYCKSDGSIDGRDGSGDGIEIVSYPMTLNAHRINARWKEIFSYLSSNGFKSHNTKECGFHVHVSRDKFTMCEQNKVGLIVYLNKKNCEKVGRREMGHFCKYVEKKKTRMNKSGTGDLDNGDRYEAINWTNPDTFEFRFPKGTLKVETMYATLEFLHAICTFAKLNSSVVCASKDCWKKLCNYIGQNQKKYQYAVEYLKKRNAWEGDGEIKLEKKTNNKSINIDYNYERLNRRLQRQDSLSIAALNGEE